MLGTTYCSATLCGSMMITVSERYLGLMKQLSASTRAQPRNSGNTSHQRLRRTMTQYSSRVRGRFSPKWFIALPSPSHADPVVIDHCDRNTIVVGECIPDRGVAGFLVDAPVFESDGNIPAQRVRQAGGGGEKRQQVFCRIQRGVLVIG